MIIKEFVKTCSAYPLQFEFRTFEDRPVYVRYRWSLLIISIGRPGEDIQNAVGGIEIYRDEIPIDMDDLVDDNYIIEILSCIPDRLP